MNEFLVVGILFGLVLFRALMVGVLTFLVIQPVKVCPACLEGETVPVRRRWLPLATRHLEWRWCVACGWQGPARKVPPPKRRSALGPPTSRSPGDPGPVPRSAEHRGRRRPSGPE